MIVRALATTSGDWCPDGGRGSALQHMAAQRGYGVKKDRFGKVSSPVRSVSIG
jgi:hypothetical protein